MNGFVQPLLPGVICFFGSTAVEEFRKIIPEFEENLNTVKGLQLAEVEGALKP